MVDLPAPSYAILLTVFNRIEKTLQCLKCLYNSIQTLDTTIHWDIYLCDDGSSDGTTEQISKSYPDIHILQGTGNLYWGCGMQRAWSAALSNKNYDAYIWLNNDTYLYPNALSKMLQAVKQTDNKAILSGACRNPENQHVSYGGKRKHKLIEPNGSLQEIEQLNGNFVFIPHAVYLMLGDLDCVHYQHSLGDYDYGYRAHKANIQVLLLEDYIADCAPNIGERPYRNPKLPLKKRWDNLYSPLGPHPAALYHFNATYRSKLYAISFYLYSHFVCLFPRLRKLFRH